LGVAFTRGIDCSAVFGTIWTTPMPNTVERKTHSRSSNRLANKVEHKPVWTLKVSERNARTHSPKQINQIAASIREFGFIGALVTNKEGMILAGHGRYEAAKLLNLKSVPTISVEHLTKEQQRAFALADNKIASNAGWDPSILKFELEKLLAVDLAFDLEITGFDSTEIDVLIDDFQSTGDMDSADQIPPLSAQAVTRLGDVWLLGDHKIICADARSAETLASIVDRPARMAFMDPPYNVPVDGHVGGLGRIRHREFKMASGEMTSIEYRQFLNTCFQNAQAVSMDGAVHFACIDWRHIEDLSAAARNVYSKHLNTCVWVKTHAGMGSFYRSRYELILVFKVGKGPHLNTVELGKNGRYRTNVWEYAANNSREGRLDSLSMHPTVKPTALVVDAIKDCSRRGEIVIDAFGGAGTTLIAAQKCGRSARLVEIDPLYVDVTIRRWQALFGRKAMHARTRKSFDENENRVFLKPDQGDSNGR
jgi:DNA modification methylase